MACARRTARGLPEGLSSRRLLAPNEQAARHPENFGTVAFSLLPRHVDNRAPLAPDRGNAMAKIIEPTIPARLVDENEAAVRLGLNVSTLRAWRCRGSGPKFYKIGGRAIRYAVEDLAAFIGAPVPHTSADPFARY